MQVGVDVNLRRLRVEPTQIVASACHDGIDSLRERSAEGIGVNTLTAGTSVPISTKRPPVVWDANQGKPAK